MKGRRKCLKSLKKLISEEFVGITVGTFVMIYNVILYVICGIVIQSWILPLYSIVTYAGALKTVDFMVEGFDRAKGGYSGADLTVVYFVVNRF